LLRLLGYVPATTLEQGIDRYARRRRSCLARAHCVERSVDALPDGIVGVGRGLSGGCGLPSVARRPTSAPSSRFSRCTYALDVDDADVVAASVAARRRASDQLVLLPHRAAGRLVERVDRAAIVGDVEVTVWSVTMPDRLDTSRATRASCRGRARSTRRGPGRAAAHTCRSSMTGRARDIGDAARARWRLSDVATLPSQPTLPVATSDREQLAAGGSAVNSPPRTRTPRQRCCARSAAGWRAGTPTWSCRRRLAARRSVRRPTRRSPVFSLYTRRRDRSHSVTRDCHSALPLASYAYTSPLSRYRPRRAPGRRPRRRQASSSP
jgi:hypothetical protein